MKHVVFALLSMLLLFNPSFAASEAVTLETLTGTLHGTLELPEGAGPYPVALIHPGSGPTDRDGNNALIPGKNDSLKLLAEGLLEQGIASLRIDKRGVGESAAAAPSETALRFETYVADAVAWLGKLRDDERFGNLYVIGHSEGSLIGMLSAERIAVQAFVSLSGPGENAADTLRRQLGAQLSRDQLRGAEIVLAKLEAGETAAPLPEAIATVPGIQNLFRPSVQPYLSSWFQYDPAEVVARLELPVLLVQGTHDLQVRVEDAQLLAKANPNTQLELIDGMNHILKDAPTDPQANLATYSDPDLPLAAGLVDMVSGFLEQIP